MSTARPVELLIVDDTQLALGLLADVVQRDLGWSVTVADRPDLVPATLSAGTAFDVALIDLSFPNSELNGLDVMLALSQAQPACRMVVYTDGDAFVADLLRDAWEAFELAGALSKSTPVAQVIAALRSVARDGVMPEDPVLQPLLPATRSRWRSVDGYGELVKHAGHAKLWRALIELPLEPSYQDLADHTGLSLRTVANYRAEVLASLSLHYLDNPRMREMQLFAKRCRALLEPHIRARLGDR